MAKRKKQYGEMTETQARSEAIYRAGVLKDAEKSFNHSLEVNYCTRALTDLTFAARQIAVFNLAKTVAKQSYMRGPGRRYDSPMKKLRKMEQKFRNACMR